MVETGILSEDEPVELLCGVLTAVSPKSSAHASVKYRLLAWLFAGAAANRYVVRSEDPLIVPDVTSLPEPDIAVVAGDDVDPRRHATTALLVIEVAVTSQRTDTTIKPAMYAAAGVPELWVVDVPAGRLRIFRDPKATGYASEAAVTAPGPVAPLRLDLPPLDLSALFAGL